MERAEKRNTAEKLKFPSFLPIYFTEGTEGSMKRYGKGGIIMSAVNTNYEYKPAYSVSATDKADKSKETSTVRLSTDAQKYLEQLKANIRTLILSWLIFLRMRRHRSISLQERASITAS